MDMGSQERIYDLEERTAKFAEETLKLIKQIKLVDYNRNIIIQLIKAVTSVGANYMEATAAESKKDFIHKMGISKKEIKETKHWFRMLVIVNPEIKNDLRSLWQEAQELTLIFSQSIITSRSKKEEIV